MANQQEAKQETEHGAVAQRGGYVHPLQQFRDEMDRLFDGFFGRAPGRSLFGWDWEPFRELGRGSMVTMPQIDVEETDKAYTIEAELPGMSEKDVELELKEDVLTLRGEKKSEKKEEKKDYLLSERSWGRFERSFRLPETVDRDKVDARFRNGVLTVTLPKNEKARAGSKKIQIKG